MPARVSHWIILRGLITVVLALQVMEAIILLTNLMVIFGGLRVRRYAQAAVPTDPVFGHYT